MTIFTLIAAILPGLLICFFIYRLDRYEKESIAPLIVSFLLGVVMFFPILYVASFINDALISWLSDESEHLAKNFGLVFLSAFGRAAFVEELFKLLVLLIFFRQSFFNEPMDGIVYSVMIGMGFATAENINYVFPADLSLAAIRAFTAVPAHAVFGVILGYYVGLAKFNTSKQFKYIVFGFFLAVGVHGMYNFFLFQEYEDWLMILATVVLIGGLVIARKFINRHQKDSPFREPNVQLAIQTQGVESPTLEEEDNEILSAVLFEMKGKENDEDVYHEEE